MNKETISDKQAICMVITFMTGTSSVMVMGVQAKKDVWIAAILGVILSLVIAFVLARIYSLFPGKNLYDIMEICFGRVAGKVVILLFTWYIYHAGSIVIRNIAQFIFTVSLPETPIIVIIIFITFLAIWAVKEGLETIGKGAALLVVPYISAIIISIILMIPKMNMDNLRPVLYEGLKPVLWGAFLVFSFPFGEIITFPLAISNYKSKKSSYKVYLLGLSISGIILVTISTANILVLKVDTATMFFYPSYAAIARISIGDFIQRIEIVSAIVFVSGGFIKVCVYLLAACNGVIKAFGLKDYRFVVTGVGLLMINLAYLIYESVIELANWDLKVWPYYSFAFQVIFPVFMLIICEFKKRLQNKKKCGSVS